MKTQTPDHPDSSRSNARVLIVISALTGIGVCALLALVLSGVLLLAPTRSIPPVPPTRPAIFSTSVAVMPATENTTPAQAVPPALSITADPLSVTPPGETPVPRSEASTTPASQVSPTGPPACLAPEGWVLHYVEPGETLFAYVLGAINTGTTLTTHDVRSANCLTSDLLQIGQALYLPPDAAENAPPSEPVAMAPGADAGVPRVPQCDPHCTVSIRPGWRAEQIAAAIDSVPVGFWGSDFLAAISAAGSAPSYPFLAGKPPGASLEGFLFPGTYELSNVTTAVDFRDMLLAAFASNYSPDMEAAANARGITLYQALTLASIVQRESWAYTEQVLISSVLHNRLRAGMALAASVTTQYALGEPSDWWPRLAAGQINTASPYNTNTNPGLPPGPIASPGFDALRAALYPADTGYLYFTGNCRGSGNLYATTYAEHLANVSQCR